VRTFLLVTGQEKSNTFSWGKVFLFFFRGSHHTPAVAQRKSPCPRGKVVRAGPSLGCSRAPGAPFAWKKDYVYDEPGWMFCPCAIREKAFTLWPPDDGTLHRLIVGIRESQRRATPLDRAKRDPCPYQWLLSILRPSLSKRLHSPKKFYFVDKGTLPCRAEMFRSRRITFRLGKEITLFFGGEGFSARWETRLADAWFGTRRSERATRLRKPFLLRQEALMCRSPFACRGR